jgi:hypothetical protein
MSEAQDWKAPDEDITHFDACNTSPLDIQDPITRARARQLNLEVSSFLSTSTYSFKNRLLPNDYIVIRNQGEDQEMYGEGLGGVEVQQGSASQSWRHNPSRLRVHLGVQEQSALNWTLRPYTESDLDVLYRVGTRIS